MFKGKYFILYTTDHLNSGIVFRRNSTFIQHKNKLTAHCHLHISISRVLSLLFFLFGFVRFAQELLHRRTLSRRTYSFTYLPTCLLTVRCYGTERQDKALEELRPRVVTSLVPWELGRRSRARKKQCVDLWSIDLLRQLNAVSVS